MNRTQEEKLKQLAGELAKDIKTGEDLSSLSAQLVKLTVEAALSAEMENHLGYPRCCGRNDHLHQRIIWRGIVKHKIL